MRRLHDLAGNRILGFYNNACLLTLSGAIAAVLSITMSVRGEIELALIALMFSGLADLFDGVVARRLSLTDHEKEFGIQLDTVVDTMAFVAAPVVLGLNGGLSTWPMLLGLILFAVAGVVRLAHFNALSAAGGNQPSHHRGLPVTYTALIFPFLFLLKDSLPAETFRMLFWLSYPVIGFLFIINIPFRKPRGIFYYILPVIAFCLTFYWLSHYMQTTGKY